MAKDIARIRELNRKRVQKYRKKKKELARIITTSPENSPGIVTSEVISPEIITPKLMSKELREWLFSDIEDEPSFLGR